VTNDAPMDASFVVSQHMRWIKSGTGTNILIQGIVGGAFPSHEYAGTTLPDIITFVKMSDTPGQSNNIGKAQAKLLISLIGSTFSNPNLKFSLRNIATPLEDRRWFYRL
jgi:hypothetical protein